jgi:hypothetical protein
MERVWRLAQLGPKFNAEIMKLQQAFTNGDLSGLQWAIHSLIHDVLEPSNIILDDMKDQIMLEQQRAETLKEAWPLETVDQALRVFDTQTLLQFDENTHNWLEYMLQCMRAVCQPILAAKPFINPLQQASVNLSFVAAPVPPTFAHFAATVGEVVPPQPSQEYVHAAQQRPQVIQQPQIIQQQQVQPQAVNNDKNYASFAELLKSTKPAA